MNKKGIINVFFSVGIILIVIILSVAFLIYYQANVIISSIRQDIFYISKNSLISFNQNSLSLNEYNVDIEKAEEIILELIKKNYYNEKNSIKDIEIKEMSISTDRNFTIHSLNNKYKGAVLHIVINVKFKPLITISAKEFYSVEIHDDISISLMNYKLGENYED